MYQWKTRKKPSLILSSKAAAKHWISNLCKFFQILKQGMFYFEFSVSFSFCRWLFLVFLVMQPERERGLSWQAVSMQAAPAGTGRRGDALPGRGCLWNAERDLGSDQPSICWFEWLQVQREVKKSEHGAVWISKALLRCEVRLYTLKIPTPKAKKLTCDFLFFN